jgi:hypothetical protein
LGVLGASLQAPGGGIGLPPPVPTGGGYLCLRPGDVWMGLLPSGEGPLPPWVAMLLAVLRLLPDSLPLILCGLVLLPGGAAVLHSREAPLRSPTAMLPIRKCLLPMWKSLLPSIGG